ncbi:glycosyltransferase [Tamlana sp. 2_MG-2023]|uniref:glycosyltransferase n=1 Tax=unclassified Tamlana TaxID=2614803 RepID=UPI0026E21F37|nr:MULTISPECIES: glycosyltransferase [unclassified Tamlana]MDO6758742.1 glycosyltransferase [Tamlana sp. 2_MG-2023]MDO6789441.1 glycosyltransferase [Tamlana sp. 1_MG-2023]
MSKTLNIAIFSPSQNPYSETFIQAHKNGLKGNVFYYFGTGLEIKLEGEKKLMPYILYKLHRINAKFFRKGSRYLWTQKVLYNLKKHKIDTILVEYGTHAHHLLPVLKVAKLPVTVHFHGYDASINHVITSCGAYKEVFAVAKNVIAVSTVMYDSLLKLGCPKAKLIYNVYGPQSLFETVKPKFSKKQFVAIGRFTDKKAPYYTILAFKAILKKHPDAQLLIAGIGELLNTCENLIKYFNLEENIELLGVISPNDYVALLETSLAFVQHSITAKIGDMEGTPLAVLEASVAGLPVIATKHAGIPDVIVHNETGLLSDEHDVETMSANMLRVLDDLDFAKQLGAAGKQRILEQFNLQKHLEKLQKAIGND